MLEIEPRVDGRAIDVVLELGEKLERLFAIDVDGQRQDRPCRAAPASAVTTSASGLPLLPAALDELARRGAIDDEAEVAPLDHALVLAERQRHARVEVAVGGLVERARRARRRRRRRPAARPRAARRWCAARAATRRRRRRPRASAGHERPEDLGARKRPRRLRGGNVRPVVACSQRRMKPASCAVDRYPCSLRRQGKVRTFTRRRR